MAATAPIIEVPLHTDQDGVIRIGDTRITLATIVGCYQRGDTPQEIQEGFPSLLLTDIYAVIAYYLANQEQIDASIKHDEEEGALIREALNALKPEAVEFDAKVRRLLEEKRRKEQR